MPTELQSDAFDSIAAWSAGLDNVEAPRVLDASATPWSSAADAGGADITDGSLDAVYACNVCHISPIAATEGLFAGSSAALCASGTLCVYGPFTIDNGVFTTESNAAFDASLRARDPSWGYRDVEDMRAMGERNGLRLVSQVSMSANKNNTNAESCK